MIEMTGHCHDRSGWARVVDGLFQNGYSIYVPSPQGEKRVKSGGFFGNCHEEIGI